MIPRVIIVILLAVLFLILIELLIIRFNGSNVAAPSIPREVEKIGSNGEPLKYVVLGDSTTVSQGSDYREGYAVKSAEHLAEKHQVSFINFGVSGARVKDVLDDQLSKALQEDPDIILISIGANDVTHFTRLSSFENDLEQTISKIRDKRKDTKIVVTGSPDMSTVARFPWLTKKIMGARTRQINSIYDKVISKYDLVHAPIAKETGPVFAEDKELYSPDKFHPNAEGYSLWTKVINSSLDEALK